MDADRPWFRFYEPSIPREIEPPTLPLHEVLDRAAATWPDRVAVRFFVDPKLPPSVLRYRELADATLGMIAGQFRDVTGKEEDLLALHALKTGKLFGAAVGLGLRAAGVPDGEQAPWRAFGDELGLLFQVVDDLLDGDGVVERLGAAAARELADVTAVRARERLAAVPADTSVLLELVDGLAVRTS